MDKFSNLADLSARALLKECENGILAVRKNLRGIVHLRRSAERSRANTLEPLNELFIHLDSFATKLSFVSQTHPNEDIRKAAEHCVQKTTSFYSELSLNRKLYEAVKAVPARGLDEETRRFLKKTLLDFKRAGVDKNSIIRKELKRLVKEEVKVGQAFDRNIKDDVRRVKLEPADLEGLPDDYRRAHLPGKDGKISVSTEYPDYMPFMKYAASGSARYRLYRESTNRGWPGNDKVLKQLIAVRGKRAKLLGYRNWADYVTEDKMVRSGKNVQDFIDKIDKITRWPAKSDYELLLLTKRQREPGAKSVGMWEQGYYAELTRREKFNFDSQKIREYFSFPAVGNGVLESTSRLFGLGYKRVRVKAWHKDVEVYDAYRRGELIGRFYFDLHPREGKYKHAACFEIKSGVKGRRLPEAALVCNFSRTLMDHYEVTVFFHEFGHLLHFLLAGRQHWVRFSGFATEWDFVETPSQMLEEWTYDPHTLRLFAKHYKTRKTIPIGLITLMKRADEFGKGASYRIQNFYSALSLHYYSHLHPGKIKLLAVMKKEQKKYSPFAYVPGTHFYCNFGHLNGYSAMYYTYNWSRVIANDLFSLFARKGMYSKSVSRKYVNEILARGGSRDARNLIRGFLGRDFSINAFRKWLWKGYK